MGYNRADVEKLLKGWESYLDGIKLPTWEELPNIELYMDQVVVVLNEYLCAIYESVGEDKPITPAMINNYVKQKLIPAPIKKKYGKVHLALLIMICALKQPLGVAQVAQLLPKGDDEDVHRDYNAFVAAQRTLRSECAPQVRTIAESFFDLDGKDEIDGTRLALSAAIAAGYAKLLCEKLIAESPKEEDAKQGKKQ